MTLEELYNLLNAIPKITDKIAYRAFVEGQAPALPFICYYVNQSDNILADDCVYKKRLDVTVELYTNNKEVTMEEAIENAFDENNVIWEKYEDFIDSEKCYQISYEITI